MSTKTTTVCWFTFPEGPDREQLEASIARAIADAEHLFGKARVRICAAYYFSEAGRQVLIDVSTDVGECVAQIFTGLVTNQIGESAFAVVRETLGAIVPEGEDSR